MNDAAEPAPLPARVRKLVTKARASAPSPTDTRIPEGQRDDKLTQLAGAMRRQGASEGEILEALRKANAERCDPPLPEDKDLKRIAKSIGDKEPGPSNGNGKSPGVMHAKKLSKVKSKAVDWLWQSYFPLAKIVDLVGDPGVGKSAVMLDIASRGSRGGEMPDGTRARKTPFDTLVMAFEDDAEDSLRPRVQAAGGDLERIRFIEGVSRQGEGEDGMVDPSLPEDFDVLEQLLEKRKRTRLVIIDPLPTALSQKVDTYREQDVKRVLTKLRHIAVKYNVCLVLVRHKRKNNAGGNAITAGGGSIGISGVSRAVLMASAHPAINGEKADEAMAVLSCTKMSGAKRPPSQAFRKVSDMVPSDKQGKRIETLRLEWTGPSDLTSDELVAIRENGAWAEEHNAIDEALRDALSGGPVNQKEVMKTVREACGCSNAAIYRATKRIGVSRHVTGSRTARHSAWSLVKREPTRSRSAKKTARAPISKKGRGIVFQPHTHTQKAEKVKS